MDQKKLNKIYAITTVVLVGFVIIFSRQDAAPYQSPTPITDSMLAISNMLLLTASLVLPIIIWLYLGKKYPLSKLQNTANSLMLGSLIGLLYNVLIDGIIFKGYIYTHCDGFCAAPNFLYGISSIFLLFIGLFLLKKI